MSTVCPYPESWRTRGWRESIWKSSAASTSHSTLKSQFLPLPPPSPLFSIDIFHKSFFLSFFFFFLIKNQNSFNYGLRVADRLVNLWTIRSRAWGFLSIWARGRRSRRPGCRWDASITWSRRTSWLTCTCRWGRQWLKSLCCHCSSLCSSSKLAFIVRDHPLFLISKDHVLTGLPAFQYPVRYVFSIDWPFVMTHRQQWRQPWGWMTLTLPWASTRRQETSTSRATGTGWPPCLSTG